MILLTPLLVLFHFLSVWDYNTISIFVEGRLRKNYGGLAHLATRPYRTVRSGGERLMYEQVFYLCNKEYWGISSFG